MIAQVPTVLTDTAVAVAAVVTILTGLGLVLRLLARTPPSRWFWRTLVGNPVSAWFRTEVREIVDPRIANLTDSQAAMHAQVDALADQVIPNGGASMADAIVRIEDKVDVLGARIDQLEKAKG